jgi:hypothetical protein
LVCYISELFSWNFSGLHYCLFVKVHRAAKPLRYCVSAFLMTAATNTNISLPHINVNTFFQKVFLFSKTAATRINTGVYGVTAIVFVRFF